MDNKEKNNVCPRCGRELDYTSHYWFCVRCGAYGFLGSNNNLNRVEYEKTNTLP